MNILPKKRWHVRTKENIARVRRDEALAAEQQKEEDRRIRLAETEARVRYMKNQINQKSGSQDIKNDDKCHHINFFQDIENGEVGSAKVNKEYEKEKKEEKEKYEKQIGYLTYLGQDTNEATGKISWYNLPPNQQSRLITEEEKDIKKKHSLDPVIKYERFFHLSHTKKELPTSSDKSSEKIKRKKCKRSSKKKIISTSESTSCSETDISSSEYSSNVEKKQKTKEQDLVLLRQKRLQREMQEKLRAETVLAKFRGKPISAVDNAASVVFEQKYNSQFNPHLAKQNIMN